MTAETAEAAGMQVVQVDPWDEAALEAWHATYSLAESHERPFAAPYFLQEVRAVATAPQVATERWLLSGRAYGHVVCTAEVILPLKDNLTKAEVRVHTHPDHRRRGHATAMLDHVEERVVAAGRRLAAAVLDFDYAAGPTGAGDPGVELLLGRGYSLEVGDVQRTLRLPAPSELLDRLAAEAAPHHEGYALRSWVDRCPDELVESYGRLLGKLVLEAPSGGLEVEEEVYDEERIREQEATLKAGGRTSLVTVAQDREGNVVAYTELSVPTDDQGRAHQWGTLVDPGHRGRRLGLAVKVANHRLLQERMPELREVLTFNAEVNDHMIAVNEALGFVPTARGGQFQKRL
jgi:GNAT superfamily N-acetyltransferase